MIDRQYGEISFECDACDDTIQTGESEWADAMAHFRRLGWRAERVGDEWTHLCPACLDTIAHVARESAKLRAAADREADETIAALASALGGTLPDPTPFTHEHIRALVVSAFNAGALYECERRDGKLGERVLTNLTGPAQ